jgi:hypothetical protein
VSRLGERRRLGADAGLALRAVGGAHAVVPAPPHPRPKRVARPIVLPPMVGAPPAEQAERAQHSATIFVIDDSGSLYFGAGGDTTGIRYAAAQSLVGLMRRAGGGTAAVVHYGSEAPAEMVTPLLHVKRDGRQLKRALKIPVPNLGGTNVASGLARCAPLLEGRATLNPVAYLIGDGLESISDTAHAAVASLPPNSVHLLLVDKLGACDAALEAGWRSLPLGSVTRLDVFDTKTMAWQLADIFAASIGLKMPGAARPKAGGRDK